MDFGKVPLSRISAINFNLPSEPDFNKLVLKGTPAKSPAIYVGCPRWSIKEWVGKIYPENAKEKDFLDYYTQNFNCIELNATHYKVYSEAGIKKWAEKAKGKDFMFCPKMYKGVTHEDGLLGKETIVAEFLQGIAAFKNHLGPVFIQLSEAFIPSGKKELFTFLKLLPAGFQFFVEVRHSDWFEKNDIRTELFSTLHKLSIGAVITDISRRRDCVHMHLTVPKAFIRFVSNSLHPTDYTRIDDWVKRIKIWLDTGLQELYFFIHMPEELHSPELAVYLIDQLNAVCGLHLQKPTFIATQPTLF